MQIDIIGVPIDLGADRRGVDMGPSAIRYAHLQNKLEDLGYTVQDEGNVEVAIAEMCKITDAKMKYIDCIIPMSRRIAGAVATSVQAKNFPLVTRRRPQPVDWISSRRGAQPKDRRDLDRRARRFQHRRNHSQRQHPRHVAGDSRRSG